MVLLKKNLSILNNFRYFFIIVKNKKTRVKINIFLHNKKNIELKNNIKINNLQIDNYFSNICETKQKFLNFFISSEIYKNYYFTFLIYVKGGGLINQLETIVFGLKNLISNQRIKNTNNFFVLNKKEKRKDYRKLERKKFGLKKARKAPQYHKR